MANDDLASPPSSLLLPGRAPAAAGALDCALIETDLAVGAYELALQEVRLAAGDASAMGSPDPPGSAAPPTSPAEPAGWAPLASGSRGPGMVGASEGAKAAEGRQPSANRVELRVWEAEILLRRLQRAIETPRRKMLALFFADGMAVAEAGVLANRMKVAAKPPDDPLGRLREEIDLLSTWARLCKSAPRSAGERGASDPAGDIHLRIALLRAEVLLFERRPGDATRVLREPIAWERGLSRRRASLLARANLVLGQAALFTGALDRSGACLRQAVIHCEAGEAGERSSLVRLRAEALYSTAALAARQTHWTAALARLNAALDVEFHHGLVFELVTTRLAMGIVQFRMGCLGEAAHMLSEAARGAAAVGLRREEMRARVELARVESARCEYEKGRLHALHAVRLARSSVWARASTGDSREVLFAPCADLMVEALCLLGDIHLHQRSQARAERALSRAGSLATRSECSPRAGLLLDLCAVRHRLTTGNLASAEERARLALGKADRAGDLPGSGAQARRLLGEVLLCQGRFAEAAQELRAAVARSQAACEAVEAWVAEIALAKATIASIDGSTQSPEREQARGEAVGSIRRAIERLACAGVPRAALDTMRPVPVLLPMDRPVAVPCARGRRCSPQTDGGGCKVEDGPRRWERFGIVTRNRALHDELCHLARIAPTDLPVLIHGETGSGKERVAHALHEMSGRTGKFVVFNAATGQNDLFEAELFGHRRGAFTGAHRDRLGLIAQAEGGTLFLDEVADLQPPGQAALLRFLDTGEARAVGSDQVQHVHARIVAASLRPIRREVMRGRFRQDLFFRLAGAEIHVPPLRARAEDIVPLALHFARRRGLPAETMEALLAGGLGARLLGCPWPGNVRQLAHWVDQFAALSKSGIPRAQMAAILEKPLLASQHASHLSESLRDGRLDGENLPSREDLLRLLEVHRGNISAVARDLHTYRTHVYRLMRRVGLEPAQWRMGRRSFTGADESRSPDASYPGAGSE